MTIELDHIGLSVSDYDAAKVFYAVALAPLRMTKLMEWGPADTGNGSVAGFGADGKPFLWISSGGKTAPHTHIAIRAETRAQVDAFYAAAISAGGKDNGGPGVREMYHPNYYGAFVLDLDGHNIEAVCHMPASVPVKAAKPARKGARTAAAKPSRKKPAARPAPKSAKKPAKPAAAKKPATRKAAARKSAPKKSPARRGKR